MQTKILLVLILFLLLFSHNPAALAATGVSAGWDVNSIRIFDLPERTIWDIVTNFFGWLMAVFSLLGIIGFIVSGLMYLTSAGDDTQMESAKKMAQYSGYGIAVGLSGLVIMQAIFWALNGAPIF